VAERETEIILPDGRMELVVHHGARPKGQAASFVTGQIVGPLELIPTGWMSTRGMRLRPEAAGAFLQMPASEVTGHFATIRIPEPKLMPDAAIGRAVRLIERSAGRVRMDALTAEVNLSPRHFDRRFLAAVGLRPKEFARIVRFQALLSAYQNGDFPRWVDLALACGFYDQAHLANEFRQFAGVPPTEFFRDPSALALLMADFSKTWHRKKNYYQDLCEF
jgi:AraC-like DNA-binding protein